MINADNAHASIIQYLLAEVSRYGTVTIKRAYGDWTTTNLKGWKEVLHTGSVDNFKNTKLKQCLTRRNTFVAQRQFFYKRMYSKSRLKKMR
ncbi:NYN domain-containing protein [Rhodoferax sp. AJA081-3]|uniref:NYN domain-containing protein n=1 Tax=Rhodoferax sp. AJA081-3 TaxID=2752316 RepID=UPI001FD7F7A8|nr:NYN domain-containing protein [Rhodoferax sp. AJA081-3]